MHIYKFVAGLLFFSLMFVVCSFANAAEIDTLLNTGKVAIENGEYEKAVDCLGKLLEKSGDKTNDPKIVAFGSTVQAYGVWKMSNPQMTPMVIQYLNKAISADPTWEYPKKLLKEVERK